MARIYQPCEQFEVEQNLLSPSTSTGCYTGPQTPMTPSEPLPPTGNARSNPRFRRSRRSCFNWTLWSLTSLLIISTGLAVIKFRFKDSLPSLSLSSFLKEDKRDKPLALAIGLGRESAVAETVCGQVIGDSDGDGAFVFKGIRYALPPTGHRRWAKPMSVWESSDYCHSGGQSAADKFGAECFQVNPMSGAFEGHEDCLFLNVWTPDVDRAANLSVMVWIHGGFLQFGSGHQLGHRPTGRTASSTRTVFVSLNYRLLTFGFLPAHDLVDSASESKTPNFGLEDIIVALEWIQTNIKSFGGNPNDVTLFGPDGGAALILGLLTSKRPEVSRLFHRAWLIDPAVFFDKPLAESVKTNKKNFLKRTGCKDIECLRRMPAEEVVKHFLGNSDPSFRIVDQNDLPILGIRPDQLLAVDGSLVTSSFPFVRTTSVNSTTESLLADVPLLIGSSVQAAGFWPGPPDLDQWSWSDYRKYVTTSLDSFGPDTARQTLELYPPVDEHLTGYRKTSPADRYIDMVSDLRQKCPVDYFSRLLAITDRRAPVFRYLVKARPSQPLRSYDKPTNWSFHQLDAIAFFDSFDSFYKHEEDGRRQHDRNLTEAIRLMVKSFVSFDQSHDAAQEVDFIVDANDNHVVQGSDLNSTMSVQLDPMPNRVMVVEDGIRSEKYQPTIECLFWMNNSFFNYAWTV